MGVIRMLDIEVANLIAAGEVVDRPASVVKELLENAIDAGADTVTLEIRNGGISMIRVTDNGCGMSEEDLPTALKRHATSKIRSADDLARITTLGFRGEALAAIASVSDMHIISKRREDECGHVLTATDGRIISVEEIGCADGTVMLVENLFARIPARKKFLKKDATEAQAIAATAEKIAMSHPEISLTFISQGQVKFKTLGDGQLLHTLHALFGKEVTDRLIAVEGQSLGIRVHGFVGRSDAARGNRNLQNFFLNGRYIKSRTMMAALERAYTSYIAPDRFPLATLFVTVEPSSVDVNVHPTKLEIKFSDERVVFEAVYYAVRAALEENTDRPSLVLTQEKKDKQAPPPLTQEAISIPPVLKKPPAPPAVQPKAPSSPRPAELSPEESLRILQMASKFKAEDEGIRTKPDAEPIFKSPADAFKQELSSSPARKQEEPVSSASMETQEEKPPIPPYRYLGTLFRFYIILELCDENKCLIIDQHAAHERILFEKLKKNRSTACTAQELLVPLSVRLTPAELAAAIDNKEIFASVGMIFHENAQKDSLILTAIPGAVSPYEAESLLISMADELAAATGNPALTKDILSERALYQVACKAAIKGGRTYDEAEIDWLCRQVLAMPDITVCPHGRPIAFYLTKSELDRRFNRI